MTRAFVYGKLVSKEELRNYEIKNEGVKKIIRGALCRALKEKEGKDEKEAV